MAVLPPKVTGDGTTDSWSFEATNNINLNEERIEALLDAMQNLADTASGVDINSGSAATTVAEANTKIDRIVTEANAKISRLEDSVDQLRDAIIAALS